MRHLHQQGGHEIVFITSYMKKELPGVRCVLYDPPTPSPSAMHSALVEFDHAVRRAEVVARLALSLKNLGYVPDIIIGHHGWGELLNIGDVFPDVPVLGYFEFYYQVSGQDVGFDPEFLLSDKTVPAFVRLKNAINHQALALPGYGQTPTFFQRNSYPQWAHKNIHLLPEGVDLSVCRPDPSVMKRVLTVGDVHIQPYEKLITYVARNMEPYRGFHNFMRALPRILEARPDARVILVGGDRVSYGRLPEGGGTWREVMLRELKGKLDLDRIHFIGWQPHEVLIRLMQRSDAHVYLTYPFVLSWSLREAMAIGCPMVVSDTAPVRELLDNRVNALTVSCLKPEQIAEGVLELLEDRALARRLQQRVRADAQEKLDLQSYLAQYEKLIDDSVHRR
nr:glycosyltransferase [Saccharibacter sp. 17.LH.SD]